MAEDKSSCQENGKGNRKMKGIIKSTASAIWLGAIGYLAFYASFYIFRTIFSALS